MIVQCPSCSTRYRHEPAPASNLARAGCSKCDATFALSPALRQYVLRAPAVRPGAAVQRSPIGVDDPSLFERIRIPVSEPQPIPAAASVPVEPFRPVADKAPAIDVAVPVRETLAVQPAEAVAAVREIVADPKAPAIEVPEFVAVPQDIAPAVPEIAVEPAVAADATVPPKPQARRGLGARIAVAGVPAAAGAYLAYTVAGLTGRGSLTWAVLGGALGLVIGWVCLSWILRED